MLRTWAQSSSVPDGEAACLAAWQRAAYPNNRR
jgi:hypothetical protein